MATQMSHAVQDAVRNINNVRKALTILCFLVLFSVLFTQNDLVIWVVAVLDGLMLTGIVYLPRLLLKRICKDDAEWQAALKKLE